MDFLSKTWDSDSKTNVEKKSLLIQNLRNTEESEKVTIYLREIENLWN